MSLLLLNPPISRYDNAEISPPLSLLKLAQTANKRGVETSLIDLNLPPHREMADHPDLYYSYVLELIAHSGAREVGITSMGVNSHIAIALAGLIYEQLGIPVVLGGIHLSSIPEVVEYLCPTLACLATPDLRSSPESQGKWWASDIYSATEDSGSSLGDIYDLFRPVELDNYFVLNPRRVANLEAGKGCKYRCAFCYSPAAHSSWSNQNAEYVVRSFVALQDLGFRHVFLVQDNLLNEQRWLQALALGLSSVGPLPSWNGYATLPDLKPSMLPLLAKAGCKNLYIGLDSVDEVQQRSWNKRFLRDSSPVSSLVTLASEVGVTITCAFIVDPAPSSGRATTSALDLALRLRAAGAEIRLSVLTPYPRTKIFQTRGLVYSEERTAVLMDLPEVVVRNPYGRTFVDAFPWHSRPSFASKWQEFLLSVNAAQTLLNSSDEEISSILSYSGESFWMHCQDVAREIYSIEDLHKTELKDTMCSVSLSLERR